MTSIVWGSLVPRRWGAWCVEHANLHLLLLQIQICCHKEFVFVSSISYGTKINKQIIAKIQKIEDELRLNPLQKSALQKHFKTTSIFFHYGLNGTFSQQLYSLKYSIRAILISTFYEKSLFSRLPSRGGSIFLVSKMGPFGKCDCFGTTLWLFGLLSKKRDGVAWTEWGFSLNISIKITL